MAVSILSVPRHRLENFRKDLHDRWQSVPQSPLKSSIGVYYRDHCRQYISASRRDYYKITLVTRGCGIFTIGERRYEVKAPVLLCINPAEIKVWEATTDDQDGYYTVFNERLFEHNRHDLEALLHHPVLQPGATAVLPLTPAQCARVEDIFKRLMLEYEHNDAYWQEAISIYLKALLLEAKRIGAQVAPAQGPLSPALQLTHRFTDLLEKQFPIEHTDQQVQLRTAKEFALQLHTHPNYLNAQIKQVTGKTVSEHIRHRLVLEARLLLLHTDWQIAEIADSLGFEDPTNFTHFFKSLTGQSPQTFRG